MEAATCTECGRPMHIARYRCEACDVTLDGTFDLPLLAKLDAADQAFVAAFVRAHGSLKRMEELFGISYPTVKNKLNAISRKLDAALQAPDDRGVVLDRLARGEITVAEALNLLR